MKHIKSHKIKYKFVVISEISENIAGKLDN